MDCFIPKWMNGRAGGERGRGGTILVHVSAIRIIRTLRVRFGCSQHRDFLKLLSFGSRPKAKGGKSDWVMPKLGCECVRRPRPGFFSKAGVVLGRRMPGYSFQGKPAIAQDGLTYDEVGGIAHQKNGQGSNFDRQGNPFQRI